MSDLKWQNLEELNRSRSQCQMQIEQLGSKLSGQKERLKWIDHYIYMATPRGLTLSQIEARLGHRVILKDA